MQESTVRRTLIVVLCLCGVVAMWVFADQASKHQSADGPTDHGAGSIKPASRTADPTAAHTDFSPTGSSDGNQPGNGAQQTVDDHQQPPVVGGVHIISTTYNAITLGWDPVQDAGGVSFYQVTLNGIAAGETGGHQLTINWFNDDTTSHFVQVWAYDNAGNRSPRGAAVSITRPAASSPSWPKKSSSGQGGDGNPSTTSGHRKSDEDKQKSDKNRPDNEKSDQKQSSEQNTDSGKEQSAADDRNKSGGQDAAGSNSDPVRVPAPQRTTTPAPERTAAQPEQPGRPSASGSVPDARSTPIPTSTSTTSAPSSPSPTESESADGESASPSPSPTETASESPSPSPTATNSDGAEHNIVGPTSSPADDSPTGGSSAGSKLQPPAESATSDATATASDPTGSPSPSVTPRR